jgi:hypothetical protein
VRRDVEHLAVRPRRQLLHFELQIVNEAFHLGAPGTQIGGRHLQRGDAVGALQVGDAFADVGGDVGVGGLEGVEALVHLGGAGGTGAVDVGEAARPPLVVLVEPAIEVLLGLLNLLEDQLEVWIHGPKGSLEAREVVVVDLVGFQRGDGGGIGEWC